MNILIVLANPKEACFTREICKTFMTEINSRQHNIVLRDLYEMNFNPVASAADLTGNLRGEVADDIAKEQAHLLWADVITFVHPIWWIDRPAILKGYVDRVFALGFAYGYQADREAGAFKGKKGVILTSSGSTEEHFAESGKMQAIYTAQDFGTMEFCEIEMLGHLHFGPVGRRSTEEMIEGYHQQVREFVNANF